MVNQKLFAALEHHKELWSLQETLILLALTTENSDELCDVKIAAT